jgi:arginine/ornithine transport system permease protein
MRGTAWLARGNGAVNFAVLLEAQNLALFGTGIVTTLTLLFASLAVGASLALVFALLLTGPWAAARWLVGAYTYVIRGTPLLIQVYLIYYGLGQLEWIQARWDSVWPWTHFKDPFFCALLAFALNTAAYTAEMLAGAIRETNAGEIEAAQAMGMRPVKVMSRIVLPSALRRTLPAYSNEVVMMLHATSLASAVPSLVDVTGAASSIYAQYFLPFEAYLAAAAIYLVASFCLIGLFKLIERRVLRFLAPQAG